MLRIILLSSLLAFRNCKNVPTELTLTENSTKNRTLTCDGISNSNNSRKWYLEKITTENGRKVERKTFLAFQKSFSKKFLKYSFSITTKYQKYFSIKPNTFDLVILAPIKAEIHQGLYTCSIENLHSGLVTEYKSRVRVIQDLKPPVLVLERPNVLICGNSAEDSEDSKDKITINWYKDNEKIPKSTDVMKSRHIKFQGKYQNKLTIEQFSLATIGNYFCQISNQIEDEQSNRIYVDDPLINTLKVYLGLGFLFLILFIVALVQASRRFRDYNDSLRRRESFYEANLPAMRAIKDVSSFSNGKMEEVTIQEVD